MLRRLALRRLPRPGWRHCVAGLALLGALVAVVGGLLRLQLDTTVSSLLPGSDPAMAAIEDKARGFGGDPIVVMLESDQPRQLLIGDGQLPKLVGLEGQLSRLPGVAAVYGPGTVLNQLVGGAKNVLASIGGRRQVVGQLAEDQARGEGKPESEIKAAGAKAVHDFDIRYGQLVVQALPAGLPTLYNPGFVQAVIFGRTGEPNPQWHFVVPNEKTVAILVRPREGLDESAARELTASVRSAVDAAGLTTSRVTVSGVPVVTAELADEIRSEVPLLVVLALLGCSAVLLTVPRSGTWRARLWPLAVMGTAASLVLATFGWAALPVSLGVLALLPILLGIGSDFPLYLAQGAHRARVLAAGLGSAAAAACLALCPLPMVRQLGLALAAGILLVIVLSLLLARWAPRQDPAAGPAWDGWRRPRRSWRALLLLAVAAVSALGWILLPRIDVDADPQRLAAGLTAVDDAAHVQDLFGSAAEVSVVLRGQDVVTPQVLDWMHRADDAIVSGFGDTVAPIISPAELFRFLGTQPTPEQVAAAMDLVPPYLTSSVIRSDQTETVMTYGLRTADVTAQRGILDGIRSALPAPPPGVEVDVVGVPVATARAYDIVSDGRVLNTLSGIAAAGVVLLIGLRRRADAGRAVLAGVLATGWGLAILWAVGGSFTPLTVTLGALTAAVGCEFLVLLADARRRRSRTMLWGVATACLNSAVGYLVLTASRLVALRDFGLLLAGSVVLSYLAAVLVVWLFPPRSEIADDADPAARASSASAPTTSKEVRV